MFTKFFTVFHRWSHKTNCLQQKRCLLVRAPFLKCLRWGMTLKRTEVQTQRFVIIRMDLEMLQFFYWNVLKSLNEENLCLLVESLGFTTWFMFRSQPPPAKAQFARIQHWRYWSTKKEVKPCTRRRYAVKTTDREVIEYEGLHPARTVTEHLPNVLLYHGRDIECHFRVYRERKAFAKSKMPRCFPKSMPASWPRSGTSAGCKLVPSYLRTFVTSSYFPPSQRAWFHTSLSKSWYLYFILRIYRCFPRIPTT